MRQHHSLWIAGRAGCVDDRKKVIFLTRGKMILKIGRMSFFEFLAKNENLGEAEDVSVVGLVFLIHDDRSLECLDVSDDLCDLVELKGVGDDCKLHTCIVEDEFDLLRGERGIDRNIDCAEGHDRHVGHDPLRPILRDDRHLVVFRDAEGGETEGKELHLSPILREGYVAILFVDLVH